MDAYERLQEKFAAHPMGAPLNSKFLEILHILFAPEEAELATHLGFWPARSADIAEAAGMAEEQVILLCEDMADKTIVYGFQVRDEFRYCLLPTAPGLFEFPFMVRDREVKLALDWQRLGRLWEEYYLDGWGHELASSPTPMARVLPIGEAITADLRVFPFEEAARYIREARHIGLSDCPCRSSKPSCDAPLDVCLTFNYTAKFLGEREAAQLITPEQALAVLQRADDSGLVHCTTNTADQIDYICNCCPCCCAILGAMTRLQDCSARVESNFRATVVAEECLACGDCLQRCPMEAIEVEDMAAVNQERCIGCGLCASACPAGAMTLERVAEVTPPADYRELITLIGGEKDRLQAFAEHLHPK